MADGNQLAQAYSILGQATTAEYKRRRKEEKEYEKRMMRNQILGYLAQPLLKTAGEAIGKGVTDLISSPFEKKYEEFLSSEEANALKIKAESAEREAQSVFKQQTEIENYKKGAYSYFEDTVTLPEARKKLIEQYPELSEQVQSGKFDSQLRRDTSSATEKFVREHEARLILAEKVNAGDPTAQVDLRLSRAKSGASGAIFDFFSGTSAKDRQGKAIEAVKNLPAFKDAERLLALETALESGESLGEAMKFSEKTTAAAEEFKEPFKITSTQTEVDADGTVRKTTITKEFDIKSKEYQISGGPISSSAETTVTRGKEAQNLLNEEQMSNRLQVSNPVLSAKRLLNSAGNEEFLKRADKLATELNFSILRPETPDQLYALDSELTSLLSNPEYTNPEVSETQIANAMRYAADSQQLKDLEFRLRGLTQGTSEYNKKVQEINTLKAYLADQYLEEFNRLKLNKASDYSTMPTNIKPPSPKQELNFLGEYDPTTRNFYRQ